MKLIILTQFFEFDEVQITVHADSMNEILILPCKLSKKHKHLKLKHKP